MTLHTLCGIHAGKGNEQETIMDYKTSKLYKQNEKVILLFSLLMATVIGLSSCESDDSLTNEPPAQEYIDKAKEILNGDIVLSTKATMNGVDKTLLESGCPTKFNFSWREDGMMVLDLSDFTVGAMPFAITFRCATQFMNLNSWEQDEYPDDGWVKFVGTDGNVTTSGDDAADNQQGSGARVDGFLNVNTNQMEFIVDYNMMNVRTETFLQTIDKTRIDRFEEEFSQYEKDLEEAKKEQGKN